MNKNIICIDLKSFFASVECIDRGLDPFTTPLVVADISRGEGAMTLAATPYLRSLGVESRSRVFTLPKNIKIIFAKPRMKLYETYSKKVMNIYKSFVSEEDVYVFSVDEAFLDVTKYLDYYKMTDYELAKTIMNKVKEETGLTTTCGIGPNMFLCKVAMDTEAKKNKSFIAKWTYKDVETKLQEITPLNKICGIGRQYEKHLNDLKIYKLKDVFKYTRGFYIKRFGNVAGNDIWLKASGLDYNTVQELNKKQREKSMSLSQILKRDYKIEEAFTIIIEMTDMLCRKLRKSNKMTGRVTLFLRYTRDLNNGFSKSISIEPTDNQNKIIEIFKRIYNKNIEDYPVRKLGIAFSNLETKNTSQLNIFDDVEKEDKYTSAIDEIQEKYGPLSILRASSLMENSTIKEREKFKNLF